MNPILSSAMGKIVGQAELFNFDMATCLMKENSEFKLVVDLVKDGLCLSISAQDMLY